MTGPLTRQRLNRAKRKAAGLCVDCKEPTAGGERCRQCAHNATLKSRERHARMRAAKVDRIPTFSDFERLCERGED
jgi:hypothetical protein